MTVTPTEKAWARREKSLRYLGFFDGSVLHSVIEGIDSAGRRELYLSYTAPPAG